MRMIKPDDFEIAARRVALASHQLVGRDQESVALRTLFARIRNRIRFRYDFCVRGVAPEQESAALVRIIAHAVLANLVQLLFRDSDHNACSTSAIMSSILSMPTEMRTRPSRIPNSSRRAGVRSRCDALAACSTLVNTSPKLVERTQSFTASMKRNAASRVCSRSSIDTSAPACGARNI